MNTRRFNRKLTKNRFTRSAWYETDLHWVEVYQTKNVKTKKWEKVGMQWPEGLIVQFDSIDQFAAALKAAAKLAKKWQAEMETQS